MIDSHTDIVYNLSSEIAGGVIANRDFVSIRTWGCQNGVYMGSGMAVTHPSMPPQKNCVRLVDVTMSVSSDGSICLLLLWYIDVLSDDSKCLLLL